MFYTTFSYSRYECSMDGGCRHFYGDDSMDDVLVVQRETQTVRAVEPRTGQEKWNFSVSQHSVELSSGLEDLCGSTKVGLLRLWRVSFAKSEPQAYAKISMQTCQIYDFIYGTLVQNFLNLAV